jgi:hypothetical protein
VATESHVPIIIVQSKPIPAHGFKTMVMPVQFREQLHEAVPVFTAMAKLFDADIHFFTQANDDIVPAGFRLQDIEDAFVKAGLRLHIAQSPNAGSFASNLIRYSTSVNADLICAMNFSYEHLYSMFPRTDEEDLIYNDANIPVLLYTPQHQNDAPVVPFMM